MKFQQTLLVALVIISSLVVLALAADDDIDCRENALEQSLKTEYELSKIENFIKLASPKSPRTCLEVCHSILKNVALDFKGENGNDACCCGSFPY